MEHQENDSVWTVKTDRDRRAIDFYEDGIYVWTYRNYADIIDSRLIDGVFWYTSGNWRVLRHIRPWVKYDPPQLVTIGDLMRETGEEWLTAFYRCTDFDPIVDYNNKKTLLLAAYDYCSDHERRAACGKIELLLCSFYED